MLPLTYITSRHCCQISSHMLPVVEVFVQYVHWVAGAEHADVICSNAELLRLYVWYRIAYGLIDNWTSRVFTIPICSMCVQLAIIGLRLVDR